MPPTEITFANQSRTVPAVRVYTRTVWTDDWAPEPFLFCDSVTFTANPDMATATFTWRYGRVLLAGRTDWSFFARYEKLRAYVKVEIDDPESTEESPRPPIKWVGILEQDNGEQKGVLAAPPAEAKQAGTQKLTAYGLDIMLSRHVLRASVALDAADNEVRIGRALEFNARTKLTSPDNEETGNRSIDKGVNAAHVFAHDLAGAEFWSSLDAVEYLLAYHAPPDQLDDIQVEWLLGAENFLDSGLPTFDRPRKAVHGRTLRQVLDELVDRRRLLGYTVEIEERDSPLADRIGVRVFTFAPEDITFEDHTIPANLDQKVLVFDADTGVQSAVLRKASLERVDQVICQGDRIVTCFSITSVALSGPATLVPHWEGWQQSLYNEGASLTAGYGAKEIWEQQALNDAARSADNVKRVYSYFGLPTDWDGFTAVGDPFFPDEDENPVRFYQPELRFLPQLPLKTDHDYSATRIPDGMVLNRTPLGQKWEYLPMLVAIEIPDTGRSQFVDRLSSNVESLLAPALGLEDGIKWSASVRPQDDGPGIVVSIAGGHQHLIATADFVALAVDEDAGQFDWRDALFATVAMEVDQYVEGVWPADAPESQVVRRLIVDLGDEYKQHYVAPNTFLGLDAEGQTIGGGPGFIRNDQPKLEALARLIYEWYRTPRQSIELALGYVTAQLKVGDLITAIGQDDSEQTINSVVTLVKYEFDEHDPSSPAIARTSISTQFAELDARRFVGQE